MNPLALCGTGLIALAQQIDIHQPLVVNIHPHPLLETFSRSVSYIMAYSLVLTRIQLG